MGLVALLANLTKIISLIESIIKVTKGHKTIISLSVSCLLVIGGCLYFILNNNKIYEDNIRDDRAILYVDNILKKCQDKTAISIGTVSIHQKNNKNKYWPAKFKIARACDKEVSKKCILDLPDINPDLYREKEVSVDINTYALFVDIGDNLLPVHFSLRNSEGNQDLKAVAFYPSMRMVLEQLDWYKEEILQDLWVTTILNRNSSVLYVITLLSAKPPKDNTCFNYDSILINLREFILLNNKN